MHDDHHQRFFKIAMRYAGLCLVGMGLLLLFLAFKPASAYALPEYSNTTGEPCATCHVNPGGGGPRTLRGMLWTVENRPAQVPVLEGILLAPGVTDPVELYDAACAGCHGTKGEGLFASALADYEFSADFIEAIILNGARRSGMPGFEGQLTDEQLYILVDYVEAMGRGEITPPDFYPLPPAESTCFSSTSQTPCGGN